jgi:hypothetical protein
VCKKICLISVCFLACVCNIAVAERTWVNTPIKIDGQPIFSGQDCALAMRSDGTWPVVSYSMPEGRTVALTPAGWQAGPVVGPLNGYGISAATSPDGTAAFAYSNGAVMMLRQTGWSMSYYGVVAPTAGYAGPGPSIAFKNNNIPAVLYRGQDDTQAPCLTLASFNGSGWSQDKLGNSNNPSFQSQAYTLAFDSYNQANVAFVNGNQLMFGLKGALTQNQWSFNSIDQYNVHPDTYQIDMAIGAGDIPWIAYTQQRYVQYATYDVQQQNWIHGILGQSFGSGPGILSMASDDTGGIGVAYIGLNDMLTFAYNDGSGFWTYDAGIAQVSYRSLALEFDAHNNPVICYTNSSGQLSLAYDPVTVPEPASAAIIALGAALTASKRKFIRRGGRR